MGDQSVSDKCADLKLPLIDLEAEYTATGRKRKHRERLSEEDIMYCVYWIKTEDHIDILTQGYVGITYNLKNRLKSHRKNKRKTPFREAINKYGWSNLQVQIVREGLTLEEALKEEFSLRPDVKIGWNCQAGGNLGVEKEWYDNEENRNKHSAATSLGTLRGIQEKDTTEQRSLRAKENWIKNKNSYKDICKGSNNPRAILTENDVRDIKYELIPSGLSNKEISILFGVKHYVISFIRSGKNWSHI